MLLPLVGGADVTKFKTKAGWGEDPMKSVETQVGGWMVEGRRAEGAGGKGYHG